MPSPGQLHQGAGVVDIAVPDVDTQVGVRSAPASRPHTNNTSFVQGGVQAADGMPELGARRRPWAG